MKCVDHVEYARKQYKRLYRVSLSPTLGNINEAYYVYKTAIANNLYLIKALETYYGYRYRRMENFLREIRFWEYDYWALAPALVKVFSSYKSTEGELFSVDSEGEFLFPLGEFFINENTFAGILVDSLAQMGFWLPLADIDVKVECTGEVVYEPHVNNFTIFTVVVVKEVGRRTYRYVEQFDVTYDVREVAVL